MESEQLGLPGAPVLVERRAVNKHSSPRVGARPNRENSGWEEGVQGGRVGSTVEAKGLEGRTWAQIRGGQWEVILEHYSPLGEPGGMAVHRGRTGEALGVGAEHSHGLGERSGRASQLRWAALQAHWGSCT